MSAWVVGLALVVGLAFGAAYGYRLGRSER